MRTSNDRTPGSRVQQRRVAGQHHDEDQRRTGANRVERDQERHLAIRLGSEDTPGDRVVHESADAGDEAAEEQDQVLPDQPVPLDLGQALAKTQSIAGLHFREIVDASR